MTCTTLLSLPAELLEAIYGQFCEHCRVNWKSEQALHQLPWPERHSDDTKVLINLSQTCRTLRRIVAPCIYHDFVSRRWSEETARSFIFSLCEHVGSAASVRRLAMFDALYKQGDEWLVSQKAIQYGLSPPSDLLPLLSGAETPKTFPKNLDPYPYSIGMLYNLFLSRVVNLEYLYLVVYDEVEYGNFFPSTTTLSSLEMLHLEFDQYYIDKFRHSPGVYDLKRLRHLFQRLPNLKNLEISYCFEASIDIPLGSLKWLKLKDSYLERPDLERLVKQCPELETFIYHTDWKISDWTVVADGCPPGNISKILSARKDTLRHLEIQCNWGAWEDEPDTFITSLKQFTVLETVILGISCLAKIDSGYESDEYSDSRSTSENVIGGDSTELLRDVSLVGLLPNSIETFVLHRYLPHFYEPILELLRQPGRSQFPRLKKFTLVSEDNLSEPDGSEALEHDIGDCDVFEISIKTELC